MLPKPAVPLVPVTLKETVVDLADEFVEIATLDICELVMFPVIERSTVPPVDVVATTVDVGVGVGAAVGAGVTVGACVGGAVGAAVGVTVGAVVGAGVDVGAGVGVGTGVVVGAGVGVGVAVGAGVGVATGVGVGKGLASDASTVPDMLPEGIAVNTKLTLAVTTLTVIETSVCCCEAYPKSVTLTV